MKALGNIYLSWRKGRRSNRILVGVIKSNATDGARFEYLPDGVEEASKFGFTSYESFPDLNKIYTENVMRIFGQRIMRTDRHDIDDFFDFWQIDKNYRDKPRYMLAYTQGLQPTDNYEFLTDFNAVKDLSFISEICGLSYKDIPVNSIATGDKLIAIKDPSNVSDPKAVKLFKDDLELGYVKIIHSRIFYKAKKLDVTVNKVEQNGKVNRVFIKISMP